MTGYRRDSGEGVGKPAEDQQLREALQQVPLPDGLEDRLLAAVSGNGAATVEPVRHPATAGPGRTERAAWTRRAWLSAAVGGSGMLAWGHYWYEQHPLEVADIMQGIDLATAALTHQSQGDGSPELLPPADLKPPRNWQYVNTGWARRAVAYDLTFAGSPASMLLLARLSRGRLKGFPSKRPDPQSRSGPWRQIAIWRQVDVLHVLASQGSRADYHSLFLRSATVPLV